MISPFLSVPIVRFDPLEISRPEYIQIGVINFRSGSNLAVKGWGEPRLLLKVKRKKSSPKPTSSITHSKPVAVLADENAEPGMVIWKASKET